MESNLLLEQYSWYKKQQLAKAPFECLLNADIEPNPHQVNAFCAAIQALKTGGIILADEVGLGKTIEAGLVLNYVLDNGAKKVLISLPATLRKQWEVELLLRVYSIILQSAYNLSLDDEYKDVIDPYYTLVGYYNSIRELGGAVRLLQDDIPDRIQRIKKKYGMSRQRFLNHKVEITSIIEISLLRL